MASADLDFKTGVVFVGTMSAAGQQARVRFRLKVLPTGALTLKFRRLWLTKRNAWIMRHWDSKESVVANYTLEAKSESGAEFRTERLYFRTFSRTSGERGTSMDLVGDCQTATISRAVGSDGTAIILRLQGFEGFRSNTTECPLGKVAMAGNTPLPKGGALSGLLHIRPPADADLAAWRPEADALLRHIVHIMSFAGAQSIKAPIEEVWAPNRWTLDYREQNPSSPTGQNVFHPLDLQAIFELAVSSYFTPAIKVKRLFFAIEWFTMTASHTEVRLVAAMTALENLLDANLPERDGQLVDAKAFKAVAKTVRETLRKELGAVMTPELEQSLSAKLLDVNRRSLNDKLQALLDRWGVLMTGIPPAEIKAAIKARNAIVHQGHYYEETPLALEERDLWTHVIVIRELLVRIILTALGFQGRYNSFRGGYHMTAFPPKPPAVQVADV